jgi:hypothetical protein
MFEVTCPGTRAPALSITMPSEAFSLVLLRRSAKARRSPRRIAQFLVLYFPCGLKRRKFKHFGYTFLLVFVAIWL